MSLSGLDTYSQSLVFEYLGADDIVRLWLSGNTRLRLRMRQSVRSFHLVMNFSLPAPFNLFLATFASISPSYSSFHMLHYYESNYYYIPGVVNWNLFPPQLRALHLPSTIRLMQSQLKPFPVLESLFCCMEIDDLELPDTLTKLDLTHSSPVSTVGNAATLIDKLPPRLRHLSLTSATVERKPHDAPLDLRHLPLEYFYVPIIMCSSATPTLWGMLPPTLTYISTSLYDLNHQLEPSPRSLSIAFPRLVHLKTRMDPAHITGNIIPWDNVPPTLTSVSAQRPERVSRGSVRSSNRAAAAAQSFLFKMLARLCPTQISSAESGSRYSKLALFTAAESYDLDAYTESQWQTDCSTAATHPSSYVPSTAYTLATSASDSTSTTLYWVLEPLQRFTRLQTLNLPVFLSAVELSCLPKTITSLKLVAKLLHQEINLNAISPLDHASWPSLLSSLHIVMAYNPFDAQDASKPILDLAIFPSRLTSLELVLSERYPDGAPPDFPPIEGITRFPWISGDLLHMTGLQRLRIGVAAFGKNQQPLDRIPIFSSHLQLPTSLTALINEKPIGISSSVIWDGWDEKTGKHYFDKLTVLDLGDEYSRVLGAQIRLQRFLRLQKDGQLEHKDQTVWLQPSDADLNNPLITNAGIDTRIIYRLPRTLTKLRMLCNPLREPWSDELIKALPRNLTSLNLYAGSSIPFVGNTASCLQYLPPKLIHFRFVAAADSYSMTATPEDHLLYVPRSLAYYDDLHEYPSARHREYCAEVHQTRYKQYLVSEQFDSQPQ